MSVSSQIIAVGNVTRDPELRFSKGGKEYARFGLAVNYRVKRGEDWEDKPSFYDVTVFDETLAANVAESVSKGTRVIVTGRVEVSEYESKDGDAKTSVAIIADEVGPSLRWATADVTRNPKGSGGGGRSYDDSTF